MKLMLFIAENKGKLNRTSGIRHELRDTLEDQLRQAEMQKQQEVWSVERLCEMGQGYGSGRLVGLRGASRAINTQRTLGVMTEKTLKRVVEGGGPEQQPGSLLLCWLNE